MRSKAMLAHFQRSLIKEKKYEDWDSGVNEIPSDEHRRMGLTLRFGTKTLVERGRTNKEFMEKIGPEKCYQAGCQNKGTVELFGHMRCGECMNELKKIWEQYGPTNS